MFSNVSDEMSLFIFKRPKSNTKVFSYLKKLSIYFFRNWYNIVTYELFQYSRFWGYTFWYNQRWYFHVHVQIPLILKFRLEKINEPLRQFHHEIRQMIYWKALVLEEILQVVQSMLQSPTKNKSHSKRLNRCTLWQITSKYSRTQLSLWEKSLEVGNFSTSTLKKYAGLLWTIRCSEDKIGTKCSSTLVPSTITASIFTENLYVESVMFGWNFEITWVKVITRTSLAQFTNVAVTLPTLKL